MVLRSFLNPTDSNSLDISNGNKYILYEFPQAAITTYRKMDGLKQQNFILLQFWMPEALNQGVVRVLIPLKAVERIFLASSSFW